MNMSFLISGDNSEKIESFKLDHEKNIIEVVYRKVSNMVYACDPPKSAPDTIWKEIYGVSGGKIKLLNTIEAIHTPASSIPEKIEFPDQQ